MIFQPCTFEPSIFQWFNYNFRLLNPKFMVENFLLEKSRVKKFGVQALSRTSLPGSMLAALASTVHQLPAMLPSKRPKPMIPQ